MLDRKHNTAVPEMENTTVTENDTSAVKITVILLLTAVMWIVD